MPTSPTPVAPRLQRKCACGGDVGPTGECEQCRRKRLALQRSAFGGLSGIAQAPPVVHEVQRAPGRALDPGVRSFMEPRFGRDFSDVRIHTDSLAASAATSVGAHAYTAGNHIVFASGQYAPDSAAGRRLIAHELAHTVQQRASGASVPQQLEVGAAGTPAEMEAEQVSERIAGGRGAASIRPLSSQLVQRQIDPSASEPDFSAPQQRGGRGRAATIDAGRRGEDQVRVHIIRSLCECAGRNVTKTHTRTHLTPGPGVVLEICRGRVTGRVTGDVVPSSTSTGRATVRGEINVAPGAGGTGARVGVEGEVRNTGPEPQVGGRVDTRVQLPGGQEIGAEGEILKGTQTGQVDTRIGAGVKVGPFDVTVSTTNPQDPARRGGQVVLGGNIPGQSVSTQTCRECHCPVVYDCFEDIPPRDFERPVTREVEQKSRLRYYFSLDTDQDTGDSTLRAQSAATLDEVARRVSTGSRILAVTGFASPEDNRERPTPNERLALSRAKRLHGLLARRLGSGVPLPPPVGGGELLGRVPTIAPGSRLADAILDTGFGDAEDVTAFLLGSDIENPKLSEQFVALLDRVTEPADRLRLFGVDATSPAAPRLLAAIEQFRRTRGRGPRPWEGIFGFLRYATVELGETRKVPDTESGRTTGSLTPMNEAACKPFARRAESEGRFGPAAPEPKTDAECPLGEPHNPKEFAARCKYD